MTAARLRMAWLVVAAATALAAGAKAADAPSAREPQATSNIRQLTFEGRRSIAPAFSRDGRSLIFLSEREDRPGLQAYSLDLAVGTLRRLSPATGASNGASLNSANTKLAIASTHEAREAPGTRRDADVSEVDSAFDIFEYDYETDTYQNLSKSPGYDGEPTYSPNGRLIIFSSNRRAFGRGMSDQESRAFGRDPATLVDVYIMNADGTGVRRLTETIGHDANPSFSADSRRIVWRHVAEAGTVSEIYVMNADGSAKRDITHLGGHAAAPQFHSSGDYIVFAAKPRGAADAGLYIVESNGRGQPKRILAGTSFDADPRFSPDGRRLAFTSDRAADGKTQIFVADWNDAEARRLLGLPPAGDRPELALLPALGMTRPGISELDIRLHLSRLAGGEADRSASDYLAIAFRYLGLEPAGDAGGYFQSFDYLASAGVSDTSRLTIKGAAPERSFALGREWQPFDFSESSAVEGPVVFAGYGLVVPDANDPAGGLAYDSFAGLDVAGKWVLVIGGVPTADRRNTAEILAAHAEVRQRAKAAKARGALGILVAPAAWGPGRDEVLPFGFGAVGGDGVAASISVAAATALLEPSGRTLSGVVADLERGAIAKGFPLPDVTVSARVDIAREARKGRNVIGRLASGVTPAPASVLVGAAGERALRGNIPNRLRAATRGAADHASGAAGLLEVAQLLSALKAEGNLGAKRDVLFAAWFGDEADNLGSISYLAKTGATDGPSLRRSVTAYIDLDLIGRLERQVRLAGVATSPIWPTEVERASAPLDLSVLALRGAAGIGAAQHFAVRGVPAIELYSGSGPNGDDVDRLNHRAAASIGRLAATLAIGLARNAATPEFTGTARVANALPAALRAPEAVASANLQVAATTTATRTDEPTRAAPTKTTEAAPAVVAKPEPAASTAPLPSVPATMAPEASPVEKIAEPMPAPATNTVATNEPATITAAAAPAPKTAPEPEPTASTTPLPLVAETKTPEAAPIVAKPEPTRADTVVAAREPATAATSTPAPSPKALEAVPAVATPEPTRAPVADAVVAIREPALTAIMPAPKATPEPDSATNTAAATSVPPPPPPAVSRPATEAAKPVASDEPASSPAMPTATAAIAATPVPTANPIPIPPAAVTSATKQPDAATVTPSVVATQPPVTTEAKVATAVVAPEPPKETTTQAGNALPRRPTFVQTTPAPPPARPAEPTQPVVAKDATPLPADALPWLAAAKPEPTAVGTPVSETPLKTAATDETTATKDVKPTADEAPTKTASIFERALNPVSETPTEATVTLAAGAKTSANLPVFVPEPTITAKPEPIVAKNDTPPAVAHVAAKPEPQEPKSEAAPAPLAKREAPVAPTITEPTAKAVVASAAPTPTATLEPAKNELAVVAKTEAPAAEPVAKSAPAAIAPKVAPEPTPTASPAPQPAIAAKPEPTATAVQVAQTVSAPTATTKTETDPIAEDLPDEDAVDATPAPAPSKTDAAPTAPRVAQAPAAAPKADTAKAADPLAEDMPEDEDSAEDEPSATPRTTARPSAPAPTAPAARAPAPAPTPARAATPRPSPDIERPLAAPVPAVAAEPIKPGQTQPPRAATAALGLPPGPLPKLMLGDSIVLGKSPTPESTDPVIKKKKGKVAFVVEPVTWAKDVAELFAVHSSMIQGAKAIVRYDDAKATNVHILFPTESFGKIVDHLKKRLGEPSVNGDLPLARFVASRQSTPNQHAVWRTTDAAGLETTLEIRRFDDVRESFPDFRLGVIRLYNAKSPPIFPELSSCMGKPACRPAPRSVVTASPPTIRLSLC